MTPFISLKRNLALSLIATLLAGLMVLVPKSLAATILTFSPTPNAKYEVYTGLPYEFTVKASDMQAVTDVEAKIAKIENVLNYTDIGAHQFQMFNFLNPSHTFSWDGMLNGTYAEPGMYRLRISGFDGNAPSVTIFHDFEVTEEARTDITSAPAIWVTGGSDYSVSFNLKTAVPACVMLSVEGSVVASLANLNSAGYHLNWDGKLNNVAVAPGVYDWELNIDNTASCASKAKVTGPTASGKVTVTDPIIIDPVVNPVLSNTSVSANPFSPNADGVKDTTTVSTNMSEDANVTMTIENSNNVVVRTLTNSFRSAGTVKSVWDGKNDQGMVVADGTYKVVIVADNEAPGSTSTSTSVTVDNPAPVNNCAGFTDLAANYSDCNVVTWVKNEGIMTGNADGTFDPNGFLQRDQVAKISLETFKLFDTNKDYCGGTAAFPDTGKTQWSYQYICRGKALGMITGYEAGADAGKYVPARGVARVEAYALIFRNLADAMPGNDQGSYVDVPLNQWFTGFAKYAMDHSLFAGSYLYPSEQVTRLEMAKMLYKLDQQGEL